MYIFFNTGYYSELSYQAVLNSICRTMITLAEAAGCEHVMETIANDIAGTQHPGSPIDSYYEEETPRDREHSGSPTPREVQSRASTASRRSGRTSSTGYSTITSQSRPMSSLSYLSGMSWSSERTHEVTYLR